MSSKLDADIEKRTDDILPNREDRAAVTAVMYNNIFMNDTAISLIFDALAKLEKTRYWCNGVKRWASVVRHNLRRYSMKFDKVIGGKMMGFLADLNDKFEESVKLDLFKLRNACLLRLGNRNDADLAVDVYLAVTFSFGSVHNNDECFSSFPHLKHFQRNFKWMRLTNVSNSLEKMVKEFNKILGYAYQDELDSDLNVMNGFQTIANRLSNSDAIIQLCNDHAVEWEKQNEDYEIAKI